MRALHLQQSQRSLELKLCSGAHLRCGHQRQILGSPSQSPSTREYDCLNGVVCESQTNSAPQTLPIYIRNQYLRDLFQTTASSEYLLKSLSRQSSSKLQPDHLPRSNYTVFAFYSATETAHPLLSLRQGTKRYCGSVTKHTEGRQSLCPKINEEVLTQVQRAPISRRYIHSTSGQNPPPEALMSSTKETERETSTSEPAQHKPLVVGLKKPSSNTMASSEPVAALEKGIKENVEENAAAAAPADGKAAKKKEKAPKQPKQPKAAPVTAPTSPALIDLRVGHILRAIAHPNADSLYVSTIAMGDPEGTEHTQVDEETGKVVRTVCSGLKAYIPLEEMQDRKIIVVANLKPVNMRSIKSAAMVLAASPKPEEGADPHGPDRTVELVVPPAGSEAGDKVYFEGWPYAEGKGPEKQLNPKKKQWEAIQPGFYTTDDLKVAFDASSCEEVTGTDKGDLIVEGKGPCKVPTLKGAVVR